jgi:hypothetical protein
MQACDHNHVNSEKCKSGAASDFPYRVLPAMGNPTLPTGHSELVKNPCDATPILASLGSPFRHMVDIQVVAVETRSSPATTELAYTHISALQV